MMEQSSLLKLAKISLFVLAGICLVQGASSYQLNLTKDHIVADACIGQENPDGCWDNAAWSDVFHQATQPFDAPCYMIWNVSSIPDNANITSAKLELSNAVDFSLCDAYIHNCTDSTWRECDISWNNQPGTKGTTFWSGDLTDQVETWDNFSFSNLPTNIKSGLNNELFSLTFWWDPTCIVKFEDLYYYWRPREHADGPKLWIEYSLLDSCTPPALGNWNITGADICTLNESVEISGNLSVTNGSLQIQQIGRLNVSHGYVYVWPGSNITILEGGILSG